MAADQDLINSYHRSDLTERSSTRPLTLAAGVALVYVILFSFYIWLSGRIAAGVSPTVMDLQHIELIKGLLFVLVTGTALFVGVLIYTRRIRSRDDLVIAQYQKLLATEPMALTGLMTATICHDLRNLVYVVNGNVELLASDADRRPEDANIIEQLQRATARMTDMLDRIVTGSRAHVPGERLATDIGEVVRETVSFASRHRRLHNADIDVESPESLRLVVNAKLLTRSLMNLILNAADAAGTPGRVLVRVVPDEAGATIEVHDDGPGIPSEHRKRIFEPYFSSKLHGTGIGLLSPQLFARQHVGSIEVGESPLGGALFRLRFRGDDGAGAASDPDPAMHKRMETI